MTMQGAFDPGLSSLCRDLVEASRGGAEARQLLRLLTCDSAQLALLESFDTIEHVLGFWQIRIGEHDGSLVRLHFWDGSAPRVEAIHSHRRRLTSYVLGGSVASRDFAITRDAAGDHTLLEVINENASSRRVPVDIRAFCEYEGELRSTSGESYSVEIDAFHTSAVRAERAATLIVTGHNGGRPPYLVRSRSEPVAESGHPFEFVSPDRMRPWFDYLRNLAK